MDTDTVVVGAGVVGLAIARALAAAGREVVVLERHAGIGCETSSRNSGVIHAGLYYTPGSLKAESCVRGKALLYEYCRERGIAHRRCGKLVVATTPGEIGALERYAATAAANGAGRVDWLDPPQVARLEPELRCVGALHSTTTGIVDVHELMLALQGDLESAGGQVVLRTGFARAERTGSGFRVALDDAEATQLDCREFVNSAGLDAIDVARRIEVDADVDFPAVHHARGHYYALRGRAPFARLVYPVAESAGLGTHVTLDLAGRVRFGPDVEWSPRRDYEFGRDRRAEFAAAIARYYPRIDPERLVPDFVGIRAKLQAPGLPPADFRIDGPAAHGVAGLVHLFGIESPGLTAALALAERVVRELGAAGRGPALHFRAPSPGADSSHGTDRAKSTGAPCGAAARPSADSTEQEASRCRSPTPSRWDAT
ncbi:MAG: NAD(P)/FAD-dependent oxidoreductase [Steroidobacteraceae bacterium]|jgi:L-2-hydroxyglutarate oxidase LhgO|nr:NAD(P)/FAD-dependent oxidoreductase [Steroidobacteraceae bacterium]